MRTLAIGAKVNYVAHPKTDGGKTTIREGEIEQLIGPHTAIVRLGKKETANAHLSENGEAGSFHFPDQADVVAENAKAAQKSEAAEPAGSGK